MSESNTRKNQMTLLLIVAMFVLPILVAFYLNSQWSDWAPETTRNHGQLVQPVLPLPETRFEIIKGDLGDLRRSGKWILLHVAQHCDEVCQKVLTQVRQVHLAAGFHSGQIVEALVISEQPDQRHRAWLQTEDPLLNVLKDDGALAAVLGERLEPAALYVIDPLGNVMLSYPSGFDPIGLKKDLGRLLRYDKSTEPVH
jgi:hypothetical protein